MRFKWSSTVVLAAGLLLAQTGFAADAEPAKAPVATVADAADLKTEKDIESYAVGVQSMRNYKLMNVDIDPDMMAKGMKDVANDKKLLLTEAQISEAVNKVYSQVRRKQTSDRQLAATENKKAEAEFLAANKKKEGVVTLPSGLQYQILEAGTGKKPTDTDTVVYNYRGTTIDGNEFDNSEIAEQPAETNLSDTHLIAGVREAMKLMPVGSKWRLFIPSKLAYYQQGYGSKVGPYATVIYDIELLSIKKK